MLHELLFKDNNSERVTVYLPGFNHLEMEETSFNLVSVINLGI